MADLATEANLQADDAVLLGASKLFLYLWQTAWKHAPGTVSADADALHDMRVAIRRLRSALQNFEGSKDAPLLSPRLRKEFANERRDLSKLGDTLGFVRDFDVLDDYLREYSKSKLNKKIAELPGLSAFERHLQNERAQMFAPMVKKINRAREEGDLQEHIARWILGLPAASAPQMTLGEAAHRILPVRLNEVAFYSEVLDDAQNIEGHHELRKSLKRLRYTLEFFAPCWKDETKTHIKTISGLQDLLGEMNDRAVLQEVAESVFHFHTPQSPNETTTSSTRSSDEADEKPVSKSKAEKSEPKTLTAPPDVIAFVKHGNSRKRYLLGRARAQWKTLQDDGFFEKLATL